MFYAHAFNQSMNIKKLFSGHSTNDCAKNNVKFIAKTRYVDLLMKQNILNENAIKLPMLDTHTQSKYLPQILYAFRFCMMCFSFFSSIFCKYISMFVCIYMFVSNMGRLNYVAYELEFLPLIKNKPSLLTIYESP